MAELLAIGTAAAGAAGAAWQLVRGPLGNAVAKVDRSMTALAKNTGIPERLWSPAHLVLGPERAEAFGDSVVAWMREEEDSKIVQTEHVMTRGLEVTAEAIPVARNTVTTLKHQKAALQAAKGAMGDMDAAQIQSALNQAESHLESLENKKRAMEITRQKAHEELARRGS